MCLLLVQQSLYEGRISFPAFAPYVFNWLSGTDVLKSVNGLIIHAEFTATLLFPYINVTDLTTTDWRSHTLTTFTLCLTSSQNIDPLMFFISFTFVSPLTQR